MKYLKANERIKYTIEQIYKLLNKAISKHKKAKKTKTQQIKFC